MTGRSLSREWSRRPAAAALLGCMVMLACSGCKGRTAPPATADGAGQEGDPGPEKAAEPEAAGEDDAAVEAQPRADRFLEASLPEMVVEKSVKSEVLRPVVLWTGSDYLVLWVESDEELMLMQEPPYGLTTPGSAWALTDQARLHVRAAAVDPETGKVTKAVWLEGDVGQGPAGLTGPTFSVPVWHEGRIVLAWSMCNETAQGAMPCRHVAGMWNRDGSPAAGPSIAGKSRIPGLILDPALALVSADAGLFLAWPATGDKESGCTFEHGTADSVRIVRIAADATAADDEYVCGEVLNSFSVHRFGPGLLHVLHDEHIGNHSLVGCKPPAFGCGDMFFESSNPLKAMLVTGGGYAVWYDELNEEFELKRRCVDIVYANVKEGDERGVTCAAIKSRTLAWPGQGLVVALDAKKGGRHELPFSPGDHVPLDLLKKAVKGMPVPHDAVWSGTSLGVARLKGRSIMFQVLGRDAF